jgi:N-methylhydantoinase A
MIESGPAAGVEAALWMCRTLGIRDALSFDMGGTTAKLCVIRDGAAERSRRFEAGRIHRFVAGSGFPVAVPVYDLVEIGAGGGSLARIDQLGLVSVGPESAGAVPGPACYGNGREPTVTDADLVLGLIDKDCFLGGTMTLDDMAARDALKRVIGAPLGLDAAGAANGIFDIVNETMAAAARLHIAEKGCDPERLTMIAFGGAGPIHAVALARKLGCRRVILPPHAGVMSSLGLLTAPPAFERMATVKRLIQDVSIPEIAALLDTLRAEIGEVMGDTGTLEFSYVAELRHHGQESPVEISFTEAELDDGLAASLRARFDTRYRGLYGRVDDHAPLELATLRAIGTRPGQGVLEIAARADEGFVAPATRQVYDPTRDSFAPVEVIRRQDLMVGRARRGPLAIQDRETGVVIGPGDSATLHPSGAVFIDLADGSAA